MLLMMTLDFTLSNFNSVPSIFCALLDLRDFKAGSTPDLKSGGDGSSFVYAENI